MLVRKMLGLVMILKIISSSAVAISLAHFLFDHYDSLDLWTALPMSSGVLVKIMHSSMHWISE